MGRGAGRGNVFLLLVLLLLLLFADAAGALGGRLDLVLLLGLGLRLLSLLSLRLLLLLGIVRLGEELPHRLGHVPVLGHATHVDFVLGLVPLAQVLESLARDGGAFASAEVGGGFVDRSGAEPRRGHEAALGDGLHLDVLLGVVPPGELVEGQAADGLDSQLGRLLGFRRFNLLFLFGASPAAVLVGDLLLLGRGGRLEARLAGALPLGARTVEHGHLVDVLEVVAVVPDSVAAVEVRLVVARVERVAGGGQLRDLGALRGREVAEHEALIATEAGEHRGVRRGVSAVDEAAVEQDDLPVGALDAPHHVLDRRGVLGARLRPRSLGRIAGGYQIIHDGLDVGCRQILRHGLHRGRVRARGRGRLIERWGEPRLDRVDEAARAHDRRVEREEREHERESSRTRYVPSHRFPGADDQDTTTCEPMGPRAMAVETHRSRGRAS